MSTALAKIAEARKSGDWMALLDWVPYLRFLGITLENRDGVLTGRMRYAEHLVGNPTLPALHGGTLGALLEAACQFEVLYRAESAVLPKTITLTIDYLRSAKPQDVLVRARIVKQGRRVVTAHATAWQENEEKPVASATVHLLVMA
ncbi:MAG: PaaI family thioesterase [Myxococcota bacterium]